MLSILTIAPLVRGQDAPSSADPAPANATVAEPSPVVSTKPEAEVQPPKDPDRSVSLEPKLAEAPPVGRATFDVDPIADTGIIVLASGFALPRLGRICACRRPERRPRRHHAV